jgi:methylmalonyl-CoA mutase
MGAKKGLLGGFPPNTKNDWQRAASAETNENDPLKNLEWKISGDLTFAPIYDAADIKSLNNLQNFHFRNEASDFTNPRHWLNTPHVNVGDAAKANKTALDHLKSEADGIMFTLSKAYVDFQVLLNQIEWPYCSVSFTVPADFSAKYLKQYISQNNFQNKSLHGALFWEKLPIELIALSDLNYFKEYGLTIIPSDPINEIATALAQAVQFIYKMEDEGMSVESLINNIAFSIPVGNDFLVEISKLKSLRILWYQIVQVFEIKSFKPEDLYLHTRSEVWIDEKFQPHGNLLKSTISSMAAILGGTNANTVYAEKETDKTVNRMARNNSMILREESHFGKVADPLAGAYVIEKMVDEISKAAWHKFQQMIQ